MIRACEAGISCTVIPKVYQMENGFIYLERSRLEIELSSLSFLVLEDLVPYSESCLIECVERESMHMYVYVHVCVWSLCVSILFGYIMLQ